MIRSITLGLSLLLLAALGAAASSSPAFADYGVCAKTAKTEIFYKTAGQEKHKNIATGAYTNKQCTSFSQVVSEKYEDPEAPMGTPFEGGTGKYEWEPYPGPAGTNWDYTGAAKEIIVETPLGSIKCKNGSDIGAITGSNSGVDKFIASSCTNSRFGTNCYNVASTKENKAGGTIETYELDTTLVEPEGEVWEQFSASEEHEGELVAFICNTPDGEDPFVATGSLSGIVSVSGKKTVTTFGPGKGEQKVLLHTYNEAEEPIVVEAEVKGVDSTSGPPPPAPPPPAWVAGTYPKGARVSWGGQTWRAIKDVVPTDGAPGNGDTPWVQD